MSVAACSTPARARLEALPREEVRARWPVVGSSEAASQPDISTWGHHDDAPVPRPSRLSRNLAGLTILVVDDDEATLEFFAAALTACGAAVTTATTASDAARLTPEIQPDVVLSDIAMAGQDGYWLAQEIRRLPDEALSRVPIVAATAYGREHSRARVLAAGFADHLQKPVDPELLCRAVARAAGR